MSPLLPLRLSWRIIQTKNAMNGSTNTSQKIMDAVVIPPNPLKGERLCLYILLKLSNSAKAELYL
jgi:hypothetical protein